MTSSVPNYLPKALQFTSIIPDPVLVIMQSTEELSCWKSHHSILTPGWHLVNKASYVFIIVSIDQEAEVTIP